MDTTAALNDLDSAISLRIQREQNFIDALVQEFKTCATQMKTVAQDASPQVQADLLPIIDRIQNATAQLNDQKPLPTNVNLSDLVQNTRSPPPKPIDNPDRVQFFGNTAKPKPANTGLFGFFGRGGRRGGWRTTRKSIRRPTKRSTRKPRR
jgi:hypothetical protein